MTKKSRWHPALGVGLVSGVVSALVVPAVAFAGAPSFAPQTPGGDLPDIVFESVTRPNLNDLSMHTRINIFAACPSGTRMVGGGGIVRVIDSSDLAPSNGLVLYGTHPANPAQVSDSNPYGRPQSGTTNLNTWNALAGFAGQDDDNDLDTAFAGCLQGTPLDTTVVVSPPADPAPNSPIRAPTRSPANPTGPPPPAPPVIG